MRRSKVIVIILAICVAHAKKRTITTTTTSEPTYEWPTWTDAPQVEVDDAEYGQGYGYGKDTQGYGYNNGGQGYGNEKDGNVQVESEAGYNPDYDSNVNHNVNNVEQESQANDVVNGLPPTESPAQDTFDMNRDVRRDPLPCGSRRILNDPCPNGWGFCLTTKKCENIDECTYGLNNCSDDEDCEDTVGSFKCQPISDIAERKEREFNSYPAVGQCTNYGFCYHNYTGSCQPCPADYYGPPAPVSVNVPLAPHSVEVPPPLVPKSGYPRPGRQTFPRPGIPNGQAVPPVPLIEIPIINGPGNYNRTRYSYVDPCGYGFWYNNVKRFCEDINECKDNPCPDENPICINTYGGFSCEKCGPNFVAVNNRCLRRYRETKRVHVYPRSRQNNGQDQYAGQPNYGNMNYRPTRYQNDRKPGNYYNYTMIPSGPVRGQPPYLLK